MTHDLTVNIGEIEVVVTADYYIDNDGIGEIEYWGCVVHYEGVDYPVIERMTINDNPYSIRFTKIIQYYIDTYLDFEEYNEQLHELLSDY